MRVIAGKAGGRSLKVPKGKGLRPTSDRVRSALYSILTSLGADLSRVLDLYAGTGALGIEALSRGAGWCDFVEQDAAACAAIRENLALTGLASSAKVYCLPARRACRHLQGPYTLVLADPPYSDQEALKTLSEVATSPLLGPGATLALEHFWRQEVLPQWGSLSLAVHRRYGDTALSIYQAAGGED
ncbi:MAG: 16S rRNA (guanine(966)-N(2))-methyltransferase RsmD [Dehalococcoidia bacterium]